MRMIFLCGRIISHLEVYEEIGIAQSVILRLRQGFQDDVNVCGHYSTGFLEVTTPNENQYLVVITKRRWSTASNLSFQLPAAMGTIISRQTMFKRLGHIDLYIHINTVASGYSGEENLQCGHRYI
ncbi:transposable element Tcb1 transposase [Trichonephila clavipes]|nr:transposable element Tcb1 transposase [Trichonephila clavipes]